MGAKTFPILKQILASLLSATSATLIKTIKEVELNQILYFRACFSLLFLTMILKKYKLNVYDCDLENLNNLIFRGLLGAIGSFIYFYGLQLVLVSESILLNRTSPIWTSLIYIFIMKKEKFSQKLVINIVLCMIGIYFISISKQNEVHQNIQVYSSDHLLGIILILLASVTQAFVNILVKSVSSKIDSLVVAMYQSFFSLFIAVVSSIYQGSNYQWPSFLNCFLLLLLATSSLLGGLLQIQSFREGKLSVVSNISQIQIPFGYMIDLIIFQVKLKTEQIFGNILLLCSLIPLIWKS